MTANPIIFLKQCVVLVSVFFIIGCASPHKVSDVLEPVEDTGEMGKVIAPSRSPRFEKVMSLLSSLGYEGVGLEFEEEKGLELLIHVFSLPQMANRKIQLVYTGLAMSYDPRYQSLTVGGETDPARVVAYITKNIPLRGPGDKPRVVPPATVTTPTPQPIKPAATKPRPVETVAPVAPVTPVTPVPPATPVTPSQAETPVNPPSTPVETAPPDQPSVTPPAEKSPPVPLMEEPASEL